MCRSLITCFTLFLLIIPAWSSYSQPSVKEKTFSGGWFNIRYPANFTVRISQRSASAGDNGAESVFFRSPGNEVEFYVFAPQWSGEAHDIALDPVAETMGDKSTSKKGDETITLWTIQAKDGSYSRSYREIRTENTRTILGIRYRDKQAYSKYKKQYVRFRGSLKQFAD